MSRRIVTRRVVLGLAAVVLVALAWTGWQVYQVQADLRGADRAAADLRASIDAGDAPARRDAIGRLRVRAASAHDDTDGWWWAALGHLPVVGDDVRGIRAISASVDTVADRGIQPLADSVDDLDDLTTGDGIDLDVLGGLQEPMASSAAAFDDASSDVRDLDSSGYAGFLRPRFDDYVEQVEGLDRAVGSASTALRVLPGALGRDGPRDYLLVFQNNAEIRASGGLPGSWAVIHADGGKLTLAQQGTGADFGRTPTPVLPLSDEEQAVYSDLLGTFFLDANFTPDFPRTAELWKARYEQTNPTQIDGVLSVDPVALSYLLAGTGPVRVDDDVTLTPENAVDQLLNAPYLRLAVPDQNPFFARVTSAIFTAVTTKPADPVALVRGLDRAADEGRFLFSSYDDDISTELTTSRTRGALSPRDGTAPHVEVTLDDATGSKMSYYLRYRARVYAQNCRGGVQTLQGSMTLEQTISTADAALLPDYVNGGAIYGTERGLQTVVVRIYSPTGGGIGRVSIDGASVDVEAQPLDGRLVDTLVVQLGGSDDVVVNWEMTSGAGQTGDGTVGVTPGVTPGSRDTRFSSACS